MEAIKPTANAIRPVFMKRPSSALGQHPLEDSICARTVPIFVIPNDGAFQAFAERHGLASTMGQSAIARRCNAGMRHAGLSGGGKSDYFVILSEAKNLSAV